MGNFRIPRTLKKKFQDGFDEYIRAMGREVTLELPVIYTDCPNCIYDSVNKNSTGRHDPSFVRPVYIFPSTSEEEKVYPQPFNIIDDSGVTYDPNGQVTQIVRSAICPVCKGKGRLVSKPTLDIIAVVTWNPKSPTFDGRMLDESAGRFNENVVRLKTFSSNYEVCLQAKIFYVDGVKCEVFLPAHNKGIGGEHITEIQLQTVGVVDNATSRNYNHDSRVNINPLGTTSNQAEEADPHNPPQIFGDDEW